MFVKELVTANWERGLFKVDFDPLGYNPGVFLTGHCLNEEAERIYHQYGMKYSFASMFWYDGAKPNYFESAQLHELYIDIDNLSLDYAFLDTRNFIRHLEAAYDIDPLQMRYYFSGAKGFHILIPAAIFAPGDFLYGNPTEIARHLETFMKNIAFGFSSIDCSIYDSRRVFRIPGAYNPRSGLRKIELEPAEIFFGTLKEIRAYAADESRSASISRSASDVWDRTPSPSLQNAFTAACAMSQKIENVTPRSSLRDLFGPAGEGGRNNALVRLAGLLRARDVDLDLAQLIAGVWNKQNTPPLSSEEVSSTVYKTYRNYTK